jgi:hypothetical protein
MREFVRHRGTSLALVVVVMSVASVFQSSISYTFAFGDLHSLMGLSLSRLADISYFSRIAFVAAMVILWLLGKKHTLMTVVVIANAYNTLVLLIHTGLLTSVLAGLSARTVGDILLDVVVMGIANILIFSVWYWVIDPPGVEEEKPSNEPWVFLFPQRSGALPGFESWAPRYPDYLFIAFTTSFAFSPTDTLPLTRTAKMLMLVQATISVVTLTGVAGSAINILAGTAAGK